MPQPGMTVDNNMVTMALSQFLSLLAYHLHLKSTITFYINNNNDADD